MFDRLGDVQTSGMGEEGLFYDGMRHLSELSLKLWSARPLLLSSTVATNNFLFTADLANLDVFSDGAIAIHRGTSAPGAHKIPVARFLLRETLVREPRIGRPGSSGSHRIRRRLRGYFRSSRHGSRTKRAGGCPNKSKTSP